MRRYFTPTVLAAVMVVGLAAIVGAQFPGGGRGMQGQGMGQGMGPGMRPGMGQGRGMMGGPEMGPGRGGPMAALKLTPEQRKQIQELQEKHRGANEPAANTLRGLHEQLRAALFSETPDDARAIALLESVSGKTPGMSPIKQLAAVLLAQIAERMRGMSEERKKSAAAQEKLDQLRAVERSLLLERNRNAGGAGGGGGGGGTGR